MTNFEMTKEFNKAFGCVRNDSPTIPDSATIDLGFGLVYEEFNEVCDELSVEDKDISLPKLAKELADLLVVTYGLADRFGIDMDKVFAEVHRSNMSKLDENGKPIYREDGKVLKSDRYSPANIEAVLFPK